MKHAFCFQYQMSDWAYIHMLMQKEGIFCYTEQGEHGDVLVFGGPARLAYHGVDRVVPGQHPTLGALRLNLTFRRVS